MTFCDLLDIRYPITQAPMAGGTTTPPLIAAVSNAGGFDCLGTGYLSADAITREVEKIRALTDQSFGINLFVPGERTRDPERVAVSNCVLERFREDLGIETPLAIDEIAPDFDAQLAVAIAARTALISVAFGALKPHQIAAIKAADIRVSATATTVAVATRLANDGIEFLVTQGFGAATAVVFSRRPRYRWSARWLFCRRSPTRSRFRSLHQAG